MKGSVIVFSVFVLIYMGISLGVFIRFLEEKKYYLVIFAPVIPMLVLIFNIQYLFRILFRSKKMMHNRIKIFAKMLYIMIRYYNILIQFNVYVFVKSNLNSRIKSAVKNVTSVNLVGNYVECFKSLYNTNTNFMMNGLKVS